MAATVDATVTTGNSADGLNQQATGATSITCSGINVTANATGIISDGVWVVNVGSPTCTWNGVSMTAGPIINSGGAKTGMWVLPSPASGNKNLVLSWTTAADCYLGAMSVANGDIVTVIKTADSVTATNTTSITVTSDANGMTHASFAVDGGVPTVNFTKLWAEAPLGPGGGASYTSSGSSNAHTFTGAGGTVQALVGVHILAGTAASGGIGPFQLHGAGSGPIARKRFTQRLPDPTGFPPTPPDNTRVWQPFKKVGPAHLGPPGRMAPQRYPDTVLGTVIIVETIGAWNWKGQSSPLSTIIKETIGSWSWVGKTSPLSVIIKETIGSWTWLGTKSPLSIEIVSGIGKWTWAGTSSPLSIELVTTTGKYTWKGTTSPLSIEVVSKIGGYTWSGTSSPLSGVIVITESKGAYTWAGVTAAIITGQFRYITAPGNVYIYGSSAVERPDSTHTPGISFPDNTQK